MLRDEASVQHKRAYRFFTTFRMTIRVVDNLISYILIIVLLFAGNGHIYGNHYNYSAAYID